MCRSNIDLKLKLRHKGSAVCFCGGDGVYGGARGEVGAGGCGDSDDTTQLCLGITYSNESVSLVSQDNTICLNKCDITEIMHTVFSNKICKACRNTTNGSLRPSGRVCE